MKQLEGISNNPLGLNIARFIARFLAFTKPNCFALLLNYHLAFQAITKVKASHGKLLGAARERCEDRENRWESS